MKRDKISETKSIKVKWADRFYILRNHIIHGDVVLDPEFLFEHQRHIDIATMFFVLLTKKLFNERLGDTIFYDRIIWYSFRIEMKWYAKGLSMWERLKEPQQSTAFWKVAHCLGFVYVGKEVAEFLSSVAECTWMS